MIRPISIVRYEYFYIGSFLLGLVASALSWSQRTAVMAANPVLATMPWFVPMMQIVGVAIAALLWYFTARNPSVVAKWIVVVFAGFGAVGMLISLATLAMGSSPFGGAVIVSLIANAVYIVAAVLLFKPDAKLWFGEIPTDDRTIGPEA